MSIRLAAGRQIGSGGIESSSGIRNHPDIGGGSGIIGSRSDIGSGAGIIGSRSDIGSGAGIDTHPDIGTGSGDIGTGAGIRDHPGIGIGSGIIGSRSDIGSDHDIGGDNDIGGGSGITGDHGIVSGTPDIGHGISNLIPSVEEVEDPDDEPESNGPITEVLVVLVELDDSSGSSSEESSPSSRVGSGKSASSVSDSSGSDSSESSDIYSSNSLNSYSSPPPIEESSSGSMSTLACDPDVTTLYAILTELGSGSYSPITITLTGSLNDPGGGSTFTGSGGGYTIWLVWTGTQWVISTIGIAPADGAYPTTPITGRCAPYGIYVNDDVTITISSTP